MHSISDISRLLTIKTDFVNNAFSYTIVGLTSFDIFAREKKSFRSFRLNTLALS